MKKIRIITAALSALTALSVMSAPAAAKLEVVESEYVGYEDMNNLPETWITSNSQQWDAYITIARNEFTPDIASVEFIVTLEGDAEQYEANKASGFLSDGETAFVDFSGAIGISADSWLDFKYENFSETDGGDALAAVKSLGDNKYSISADLTGYELVTPDRELYFRLSDWGTSDEYWLKINELFVRDADGKVLVHFDEYGASDFEYTAPESEAEETPEETAAETTAAENEAPAEAETTAAETTAAEATTTRAVATEGQSGTVQSAAADFGSRDSSLVIVGIAAGVVIIAVIIVMVMIMLKKKK